MKKCDICGSEAYPKYNDYISKENIKVENVATYVCSESRCRHTWLPIDEEKRIDEALGIKNCQICLKRLDTDNPLREDCGGDCLECMADIVEDPDCIEKVKKIRGENNAS